MQQLQNENIKECYDALISKKYGGSYEFNRWFSSARLRLDYAMMYRAIEHALEDISFTMCLEAGPGPGTWTRLLYRKNPQASFRLVDISQAMREQFELEMRHSPNVEYIVGDVMEEMSKKGAHDLFFSSRMFEYLENKEEFLERLYHMLRPNGTGIIVTKDPRAGLRKKRDERFQHSGAYSSDKLAALLGQQGFKGIVCHPAVIRIPLCDRFSLKPAEHVFNQVYTKPLARIPSSLVESYVVSFKK